MDKSETQVAFAVGTGRCGTKFLYRAMQMEPEVAAVHERNPLNEAFHRYCQWYGLPVDDEGFLHAKAREIDADLESHRVSFEASAHLSLSIRQLYQRSNARFVLLVRSPEKVVNSYIKKGWYQEPFVRGDPSLALGYQDCEQFHHFLGRIAPNGDKFVDWNQMTRVGKLAWYWSALNEAVLDQFKEIPESHWRVQKLEELDYEQYRKLTAFMGVDTAIGESDFRKLVDSRPNAFTDVPTVHDWSEQAYREFASEVAPLAAHFGYVYGRAELKAQERSSPKASKANSAWWPRPRRWLGRLKRKLG